MASTVTVTEGGHPLSLSPDGYVTLGSEVMSPQDWGRIASVVRGHHVRLGLVPDTSKRRPMGLLRPAPLWIKVATVGRVRYLPGGPSLRGIRLDGR